MYNACFFHKVELIDPCNGKDIALPLVFTYNSLDMGANKVWQASQNDAQAQQQYVELQNFGLKADEKYEQRDTSWKLPMCGSPAFLCHLILWHEFG